MQSLAVGAIGLYQRYVSPYKGFRCAKRAAAGGWSCSEFGKRAFARLPTAKAVALLRRRFAACRAAYEALLARRTGAKVAASTATASLAAAPSSGEQERDDGERKRSCASRTLNACDCGVDLTRPPASDCSAVARIDACPVGDLALPCDCGL